MFTVTVVYRNTQTRCDTGKSNSQDSRTFESEQNRINLHDSEYACVYVFVCIRLCVWGVSPYFILLQLFIFLSTLYYHFVYEKLRHDYWLYNIHQSGLAESSQKCEVICFWQNSAKENSIFSSNFQKRHENPSYVDEVLKSFPSELDMLPMSLGMHSGIIANMGIWKFCHLLYQLFKMSVSSSRRHVRDGEGQRSKCYFQEGNATYMTLGNQISF